MTVRFKCQSEYQKSYRLPRSRSVSPQRCASTAGLRSDQMGISREPGLQRRRKFDSGGLTRSCSSLLGPAEPQLNPYAVKTAPSAASRSRSALSRDSPAPPVNPDTSAEPETAAGPGPSADPEPSEEPAAAENNSVQPRPLKNNSQSQPSRPPTANGPQPPAQEVQHALRWKAGLRPVGQRSRGHRSEYHRQFSWKKPMASASPLLTAEQVLYSSSRSVPPFKKHPVAMETEYQQNFQGAAPPDGPRLRKHLEHQRIPLFQTHMINKKKKEESEKKPRPSEDASSSTGDDTAQVQRRHRTLTEYESSFRSPLCRITEEGGATERNAPQVTELRQKALSYRQRAWGANFSRDHLSQLLSEHNALWEPTDTTTDSNTSPPSPRPEPQDPHPDLDSRGSSRIEALDLPSRSSYSSKRSSVSRSGGPQVDDKNTPPPPSPAAERRTAWGEEEEENPDDEEGRLPTPRLKQFPVLRTHHDLTTPTTGGAILVGKLKDSARSTPTDKLHRSVSAVSVAGGAETAAYTPGKPKEAWSEKIPSHHPLSGPSPEQKAASPPTKPIKAKQASPAHVAPPPQVPPPVHCFHGSMRHPDFQHNGELGVRFRELQCSGGCGSDEDDRMSVMSWRSAASCSMASAVLERAQKRRDNFWGKR